MTASKYDLQAKTYRIRPETHEKASARARAEGTTLSEVIRTLIEGYADGQLDLPIRVYT